MNHTIERRQKLLRMVVVAVFCAMAYACQFIFRIHVSFLTFDAKDAVMAIGAMIFGPVWGVVMSLLVSLLEFVTLSGTGVYGLIMNFASSAAFTVTCAGVYQHKRTMTGAIIGLATAVLTTTALMMVLNLVVTPIYMTVTVTDVITMIPTLLLPFNLTKALLNAGLVLVLYKPVTVALRKARVLADGPSHFRFDKKSLAVLICGLLLIISCVIVFLFVLHGSM